MCETFTRIEDLCESSVYTSSVYIKSDFYFIPVYLSQYRLILIKDPSKCPSCMFSCVWQGMLCMYIEKVCRYKYNQSSYIATDFFPLNCFNGIIYVSFLINHRAGRDFQYWSQIFEEWIATPTKRPLWFSEHFPKNISK